MVYIYEKAFAEDNKKMTFLQPLDTEGEGSLQTPNINNNQTSGKSPSYYQSPVILDFLEDDNFFADMRQKSKTEFVKRERAESEESYNDEVTSREA